MKDARSVEKKGTGSIIATAHTATTSGSTKMNAFGQSGVARVVCYRDGHVFCFSSVNQVKCIETKRLLYEHKV